MLKYEAAGYTTGATKRRVRGDVELAGIVGANGVVKDICVLKSLDPDLDLTAAAAARVFSFAPGQRDGQPVAVRVRFTMSFQLKP